MTPDEKIIAAYRALVARATWIAGRSWAVDLSDRPEVSIVGEEARLEAADRAALAQLKHKYEGGPDPRHTAAQPAPGVLSMPWPPAWPLHPPSMQPGHLSAAPPHFTGLLDDPSLSTGDPHADE